jgi:hypothetical protein
MSFKLLVDQYASEDQFEYIKEETNNKSRPSYYVTGPYMMCEEVNKNKRIYDREEMHREAKRYKNEMIDTKRAMGELNHPSTPDVSLERACHLVTELRNEGNVYIGKSKLLSTPCGLIVQALIDDGVKIGMSTRALGKLNEQYNGTSRVSDFRLVAIDCVADPSCPKAFVNGILESKEYVLSEDGSFEESFDKFQDKISKLPRKNVEDYLKDQILEFFEKISKVM